MINIGLYAPNGELKLEILLDPKEIAHFSRAALRSGYLAAILDKDPIEPEILSAIAEEMKE